MLQLHIIAIAIQFCNYSAYTIDVAAKKCVKETIKCLKKAKNPEKQCLRF